MKNIITISREFGSGGRSIGRAVAEQLGYSFYDRELIEKIAEETGLSKDFIEKNGEHSHGTNIFSYAFVGRTAAGQSMEDYLWKKQREIILKLAEEGKCVIVGRCADYILRDRKDCLNVFQNTANGNSDVESNKVFAILAYIGILVLVPIFAAPNSKFAKFHANQGLVLFIAEVILLAIAWTLGGLWIIRLLVNVARILCLVLAILGIVAAAQGEEKELPVIGSIHILK